MKVRRRTVATIEHDDQDIELEFVPIDTPEILEVGGTTIVVGYLVLDEDCGNPLEENDAIGEIYVDNSNVINHNPGAIQEALGLNSEWEPDIEQFQDETEDLTVLQALKSIAEPKGITVENFWADSYDGGTVECTLPDGTKDKLTYQELGTLRWDAPNEHYILFLDERAEIANWEDLAREMWNKGRDNGTVGNKYAVSLDVYEHSGTAYSVSGEGMQCMFDTAGGGAIWVPDEGCLDELKNVPEANQRAWCIKAARSACEEYTAWCNGWCYGVVIEVFEKQGEEWVRKGEVDACWGYIGSEYAEEQRDYEMKQTAESLRGE